MQQAFVVEGVAGDAAITCTGRDDVATAQHAGRPVTSATGRNPCRDVAVKHTAMLLGETTLTDTGGLASSAAQVVQA
jgi:hypothetical protein